MADTCTFSISSLSKSALDFLDIGQIEKIEFVEFVEEPSKGPRGGLVEEIEFVEVVEHAQGGGRWARRVRPGADEEEAPTTRQIDKLGWGVLHKIF